MSYIDIVIQIIAFVNNRYR